MAGLPALLDAALRGGVIALLALLGGQLMRQQPRGHGELLGAALALGLGVQAIGSAPSFEALVPRPWQAPLVAVSVGNAVLFWLFARALFDDEFRLRPVHGLVWALAAGLSALNCGWLAPQAGDWPLAAVSVALQRWLPMGFGLLVGRVALTHWRDDLVEHRRRLRAFIVLAGCAYMAVMVAARLRAPQGQLSAMDAGLDMAGLLAIVAVLAWRLLQLPASGMFPVPPRPAEQAAGGEAPDPDPAPDQALVAQLLRLMEQEHFYRQEDLSLARLADAMQLPEYRLRRLINQGLGHRNFSSFINSFRLLDAKAGLSDPARRALPVLSIALEAGFQSIGPFNRAFKAETGLTPSEFRKQKLTES